jgi:hypothetical protein
MCKFLCTAVAGLCVTASIATASPASAGVRLLTLTEMDRVTAGAVTLNIATLAAATGTFVMTGASGGGGTNSTPLPAGGVVQSGVVGGPATAVTNGGTIATGAASSGTVSGTPLANGTISGTAGSSLGQSSVSFTFVSGGTVFLP